MWQCAHWSNEALTLAAQTKNNNMCQISPKRSNKRLLSYMCTQMYLSGKKKIIASLNNQSHMCRVFEFYKSQSLYESLCTLPKGDILWWQSQMQRESERMRGGEKNGGWKKGRGKRDKLYFTKHLSRWCHRPTLGTKIRHGQAACPCILQFYFAFYFVGISELDWATPKLACNLMSFPTTINFYPHLVGWQLLILKSWAVNWQ